MFFPFKSAVLGAPKWDSYAAWYSWEIRGLAQAKASVTRRIDLQKAERLSKTPDIQVWWLDSELENQSIWEQSPS